MAIKIVFRNIAFLVCITILAACKEVGGENSSKSESYDKTFPVLNKFDTIAKLPNNKAVPEGMVFVPGGVFTQGKVLTDVSAMAHESPPHKVAVTGFFMDSTEVTNAQFSVFVAATGYKTVAERAVDWGELKKQLPPNTQKPPDSLLAPGSLTFSKTLLAVNLNDYQQWWNWTIGANWKHPNGPSSSILGKEDHPVVHITVEDAQAYCDWKGVRLPTEAEWEYAARGKQANVVYPWGAKKVSRPKQANTWTGIFPRLNTASDGFESRAPVKSYPANVFGLYDMAGNVWELTSDVYSSRYYAELAKDTLLAVNPKGPQKPNIPSFQYVIKGGSFLCSESYCASYRSSARMGNEKDSSAEHIGFRTVKDVF